MFLLVFSLATLLCQPGAEASEKETTQGLLYLQKYGYLSPRNQTAALTTPEGLQERLTTSIILTSIYRKIFLNILYFEYLNILKCKIDEAGVFRTISRRE